MARQTTLKKSVRSEGIGLHSGSLVTMTLRPAKANAGIVFKRLDVPAARALIPCRYDAVCDTRLGTTISNAFGVAVSTVEHLTAALWGAGIDNVLIELDGPEVPIMDGSSEPFMQMLEKAGVSVLSAPRRMLRVLKAVEVRDGESFARIEPNFEGDEGCVLSIEIAFDHPRIGRQLAQYDFREESFGETLSRARTFGFEHEVKALHSRGLALGGSLDNAIVMGESGVLNAEGLRYADEFVRHKALDCLGDLYIGGHRIDGRLTFVRPGHSINNQLLRALMTDESAYLIETGAIAPAAFARESAPAYL